MFVCKFVISKKTESVTKIGRILTSTNYLNNISDSIYYYFEIWGISETYLI